jgi:formiminotetrahydrofolate cyclodeaminase
VTIPRPGKDSDPGPWHLLDHDVDTLLDHFEQDTRGPGVGSAAALVTAMAAALLTKTARLTGQTWEDAAAVAAQADALRARAAPLAQANADVYAAVLEQLRSPAQPHPERHDFRLGRALEDAATVPLRIAEIAADVAELAAHVTAHASPDLRPDSVGAAILAEASARAAVHLVEINLAVGSDVEYVRRCREAVVAAQASLRRALAEES